MPRSPADLSLPISAAMGAKVLGLAAPQTTAIKSALCPNELLQLDALPLVYPPPAACPILSCRFPC